MAQAKFNAQEVQKFFDSSVAKLCLAGYDQMAGTGHACRFPLHASSPAWPCPDRSWPACFFTLPVHKHWIGEAHDMYTVENLWREVVVVLIHVDRAQYPNVRWKAKPMGAESRRIRRAAARRGATARCQPPENQPACAALIGLVIQEQLFQCCIRPKTAAVPCFLPTSGNRLLSSAVCCSSCVPYRWIHGGIADSSNSESPQSNTPRAPSSSRPDK